jgi:hypothetical protein
MIKFIKRLFERKQLSVTMNMALYQGEHGWHDGNWGNR